MDKQTEVLPQALLREIRAGLVAVRKDPKGHLSLGQRRAIWSAMGPPHQLGEPGDPTGRLRRTRLAVLTTDHVLLIWEALWPSNGLPHEILDAVKQVLSAEVNAAEARDCWKSWQLAVDNLRVDPGNPMQLSATGTGSAALMALSASIWDEFFDPDDIRYDCQENDAEPEWWGAAYSAAFAYSGGAPRYGGTGIPKRREFWEWWLTEAVPAAWRSVG